MEPFMYHTYVPRGREFVLNQWVLKVWYVSFLQWYAEESQN